MKGFIGPGHSQWKTDDLGLVWFCAYNAQPIIAPCAAADSAALPKLRAQWGSLVSAACKKYDLPVEWIFALMLAESRGNPDVKSPAGAIGLMQVMPLNAGGRNLADPAQNLDAACDLLSRLQKHPKGPWDLLELSSQYNAGPAPTGGAKFSIQYDFCLVNGVGPSKLPDGVIFQSPYLRQIAGASNWQLINIGTVKPAQKPPVVLPNLPPDPGSSSSSSGGLGLVLALAAGLYFATRKTTTVHHQ